MSDYKVIDSALMTRILAALEVGEYNAIEVYNIHLNEMGTHRKTKEDESLEALLKREMDEVEELISFLRNLNPPSQ